MKFAALSILSLLSMTIMAAPTPEDEFPPPETFSAQVVNLKNAPAAPTASATAISKRQAPETVILSNCDPSVGSFIFYYEAGHEANGIYDDFCRVTTGSFVSWEGRGVSCKFASTGVIFRSSINVNAQDQADFTVVGSGSNGFRTFTCRKDNKRVHYATSTTSCKSIYYCQ